MTTRSEESNRRQKMWKYSLQSASRTALACIIVEVITIYTPNSFKNHFANFPAFSYFTMVLMVTNATLGDTVRGCCLALCATLQSVVPAILCLWIAEPTRLTPITTSLVLFICALSVALPEWTHIVAKRIALGQLVVVYVVAYIYKQQIHVVMHPIHVAASTSVGAFAGLLALLFPYPRLAFSEVQESSKLFAENVSERLKLFVKAFCAEDGASSQALISQAKCLAAKEREFLQCIDFRQDSMHWERFLIKFLQPYYMSQGDRFQELETLLRGIEIALTNTQVLAPTLDEGLKDKANKIGEEISQNLERVRSLLPCEPPTVPESDTGLVMNHFRMTIPFNDTYLSSYFFLFCMKLLHTQSRVMTIVPSAPKDDKSSSSKKMEQEPNQVKQQQNGLALQKVCLAHWPVTLNKKRLIPALKCSLSLSFAVLLGLYYNKPNGFWAGLPVAIGLAASREPTLKATNIKLQGTALGSVYGILGSFVFQTLPRFKFLALFPWFIFTSFLQQSKMYGQSGAVCAVVGAVLILARENFGPTKDFAIARIVETFIGLSCSIMVELLLQPTRASTLAKAQLSTTLGSIHKALASINLGATNKTQLLESQKMVKMEVVELEKYVSEAEVEPNFWFLPFNDACYGKLVRSLGKMADLLLFVAHAIDSLDEQLQRFELLLVDCEEEVNNEINNDLELIKKVTSSSMKCLQEISSIESLKLLEKQLAKGNKSYDLELGKSSYNELNLDETEKIMSSLLDHFKGVVDRIDQFGEDEREMKNQVVMSLSALGFCLSCLMRETSEVEKGIKELLQWENPLSNINLNEISCKIHALYY